MAATRAPAKKSAQRKEDAGQRRKAALAPAAPMLRTSERRDFRRCRQRWYWGWREGLKGPASGALWFGEGIHVALAEWYLKGKKRGPHPAETFEAWVGEEKRRIWTQPKPELDEAEVIDASILGKSMLKEYVEKYGKDPQFKFVATEQPFQIVVPTPHDFADHGRISLHNTLYCGTFDGVYRDEEDGKPWLIEHKTAKAITTAHLPLDDQAGSYWLVATQVLRDAGAIGPKEELEGILYNFLRKAMPDDRKRNADGQYLNKDGSVSRSQPAAHFLREPVFRFPGERKTQLRRIQDESLEMQLVRAGVLPVTKNPTRDCSWDCPFFNMCQLHEAGDDWESYRDSLYRIEDPYADHRKSAAE